MRVLIIGPIEKAGGVSTHTKELANSLKELGVVVEVYNISPNKEYSSLLSNFIKLYKRTIGLSLKLIRDSKKFDIIHVQASGPLGGLLPAIVGAFWKKIMGFRLVVTFHYSKTEGFIKKHKRLFEYIINLSDKFIVVSNKQRKAFESLLNMPLHKKIIVIPNGYNPQKFITVPKDDARKKLGLHLNDKILVNVALLLEKKGHKYLIDAMNILVNKKGKTDIKCFIIGEGPLKIELEQQINTLNLEENVKLLGFVPDDKLSYWLNAADIFVLPSLSEGNPTVMFEVLGVGLPFIGTKVGGISEIIISEDYGLLCKPANPEDLAEKILIALEKQWDKEKIRKYAEQFTWDNIAKQVLDIYMRVIENAK